MTGIMIQNIKGGVGKTTTAVHLAAEILRRRPKAKVCLVDTDQQGSLRAYFREGLENPAGDLYDFLMDGRPYSECLGRVSLLPEGEGIVRVLPSSKRLADAEVRLATLPRREEALRRRVREQGMGREFDFFIFDCPPTLNLLTYNVSVFCSHLLLPCTMDYLSSTGIQAVEENLTLVEKYFERRPKVLGILPTLYDGRSTVTRAVEGHLEESWGSRFPLLRPIRLDASVRKAQILGQTVYQYDPNARAVEDYAWLGERVLEALDPTPRQSVQNLGEARV